MTVLLLSDGKLEPYDDLKPEPIPLGDSTTNGLLYLKKQWANRPNRFIPEADQKRLKTMASGKEPLDRSFVGNLINGREQFHEEFSQALVMPYWRDPDLILFKKNVLTGLLQLFRIDASISLRDGDARPSVALHRELSLLARRQLDGGGSDASMMFACAFQHMAAECCCEVLAAMPHDPAVAREMEEDWSVDPPLAAAAGAALRSKTMILAEAIQENKFHSFSTHYLKPNRTLNLMNLLTRRLMSVMFQPFPTQEAARRAGLRDDFTGGEPGPLKYLDPNYEGKRLALTCAAGSGYFILDQYRALCLSRTMRVRLAIHRWRLVHPEHWPSTLTELVPDFLPEVLKDPWNGAPLLWDQATRTVYAVGADWNPDPPVFLLKDRRWVASTASAPGLRMELPLPASAAPAALADPAANIVTDPQSEETE